MQRFEPLILVIFALALAAFIYGLWQAGLASLACDGVVKGTKWCDDSGYPQIDPISTSLVPSLTATLATFFGASIGLARSEGKQSTYSWAFRWGGLVRRYDDRYVLLQTIAGYVYFAGLLIASWFFVKDLNGEVAATLESPFTHVIIKTCATALLGVIMGVLALVLGVRPKMANLSDTDKGVV